MLSKAAILKNYDYIVTFKNGRKQILSAQQILDDHRSILRINNLDLLLEAGYEEDQHTSFVESEQEYTKTVDDFQYCRE